MIILYGIGPAFGLAEASPFARKIEALLQLGGIAHVRRNAMPWHGPKGKLPYIEDEGLVLGDSTFIRWHLEQKYGLDFDAGLTPAQRGVAWAMEKMLEDQVFWLLMQRAWLDGDNFAHGPAVFFRPIPWPVRALAQVLARRKARQNLRAQGSGRHTAQERLALAARSFEALSAQLGEQEYLMGASPCGADATLYAFVAGIVWADLQDPLRALVDAHPNLLRHAVTMRALCATSRHGSPLAA